MTTKDDTPPDLIDAPQTPLAVIQACGAKPSRALQVMPGPSLRLPLTSAWLSCRHVRRLGG
jgi:hypothetical protein